MAIQKTVMATLVVALLGATSANASDEELSSSSYVEDGILQQTLENPNAEQEPVQAQATNSDVVMGVSDDLEVKVYDRTNRTNTLKVGLSYDTFTHKATGVINYPNLGEFDTLRDYEANLVTAFVDYSHIINNQFRLGGMLKFSATSDVDYNVTNTRSLEDPSYTEVSAYFDWLYDPIFYAGGMVSVSSLDNEYRYVELGKNYSDTIDVTSLTAYIGFENYHDLLTFGGKLGVAYVMYDYDSDVTAGLTPGYNLSSSSDSFGFYASAYAGYMVTQNIELSAGLSYMNYSMSSPDVSAQYQISNYDMEADEMSINVGVAYKFR
jgi:hypothetical protein